MSIFEQTMLLPTPNGGVLETAIDIQDPPTNKVAIICHPHPLHGGTMNNKVVTTAAKAFQQVGFTTIRFNYRGVGASTGEYGDFVGETADLLTIIDWVQTSIENPQLWMTGFSFGSYIAAQGALQRSDTVKQLITIAPAVNHADFLIFAKIKCPWLVIQGTDDNIVPQAAIHEWLRHIPLTLRIKLIEIPQASHFFHGKLIELRDIIKGEIIS